MNYCKKCLYPDTKPGLRFDANGICDACNWAEEKKKIDWNARRKELTKILEHYKSKDGSRYDCVIPVSGGKDSHYQTYVITKEFGLRPLLVSFHPRDLVPLGRKNIENLKKLGVDYIEFTPNPIVYTKLEWIGLTELGDVNWPEHIGIFTVPVQVAVAYKIPLIIWGENPQQEYGGEGYGHVLDYEWLKKYGGFWLDNVKPEYATKHGIAIEDLRPYIYPPEGDLKKVGIHGIFLFSYLKYDIMKQLDLVTKLGFSVNDGPKEGTYQNWENLDTRLTAMHDYFKWVKYGFGRATDHASIDIRDGRLTREDGLRLVKKYEGKIPERYFKEFLDDFKIRREEFYKIVDKFANKDLFKKDSNGNLWRDETGNLEKLQYDNE